MRDRKETAGFLQAAEAIGGKTGALLLELPEKFYAETQEIGLRAGRPVTLVCGRDVLFPDGRGGARAHPVEGSPEISAPELAQTLHRMCGYSVYSYREELREGFLTLRGGHRVGVAGTAVVQQGVVSGIREVSSLNIRLAREKRGCAAELLAGMGEDIGRGLLLAGPPAGGKTTLLRDLARQLSSGENGRLHKVTVVDERCEIAGCWHGEPQNDVGICCDVLSGCPKAIGILQAARSLSPEFILCDEVGTREEIEALSQGVNTGAALIATIHAGSLRELMARPQTVPLLQTGAFGTVVLLGGRERPGSIRGWYKAGDLLAQIAGAAAGGSGRELCRASGVA